MSLQMIQEFFGDLDKTLYCWSRHMCVWKGDLSRVWVYKISRNVVNYLAG